MDYLNSWIECEESEDAVEGIRLKEYHRRGSRYKRKPFRPELEDIHEGEEAAALKSSESDEEDDIVVFRGGKTESATAENKTLEPSLMSSLLGLDFW